MKQSRLTYSLLLSGLVSASLLGQAAPAKSPKTPVFISPDLVNSVSAITPPPAIDSKRMARDIAEIYGLHRSATQQEIEKANYDNKHEDLFAIGTVLGDKFTKESMPATAALWADMNNDQGLVVSAAKKYFQHPRPYDLDPNIKSLCGSKPRGAKNSYPSGHGTVGYLSAAVLSLMVPERAELLQTRAAEYGHNRIVCGDHYAADIPASKEAAELILSNMIGNAKFQQEFGAAKVEVRQALGL